MADLNKYLNDEIKELKGIIEGYKEAEQDHKKNVRFLDEIINGKENAARQASFIDIIYQCLGMRAVLQVHPDVPIRFAVIPRTLERCPSCGSKSTRWIYADRVGMDACDTCGNKFGGKPEQVIPDECFKCGCTTFYLGRDNSQDLYCKQCYTLQPNPAG